LPLSNSVATYIEGCDLEVERTVVTAEVALAAEELDGTATAATHNELAAATKDG
jgi:hypothetical protein